jgi:hypothetical protein
MAAGDRIVASTTMTEGFHEMTKWRTRFLATAALAALSGPAMARCNQPYAPVIKINANSTKQDVEALRSDVLAFIAASDVYQACLLANASGSERIDASQSEKQRIGREFNAALHAFLASHPS